MDAPSYADLYDDLAAATGQTPGGALNAQLERFHERHPAAFTAHVRNVIAAYAAGRIHNPWGFLGKTCSRVDDTRPTPEAEGKELELAMRKAEQLIRNLGPNLTTEAEAITACFGPPELTADLATLERMDSQLTGPQRAYLGDVLKAQLAYTRTHGRQQVPGSGGPLRHHDTPANRARILALWQAVSQTAPQGLR